MRQKYQLQISVKYVAATKATRPQSAADAEPDIEKLIKLEVWLSRKQVTVSFLAATNLAHDMILKTAYINKNPEKTGLMKDMLTSSDSNFDANKRTTASLHTLQIM